MELHRTGLVLVLAICAAFALPLAASETGAEVDILKPSARDPQCIAVPFDEKVIAGYLLFGVDAVATPKAFAQLAERAPELALLLMLLSTTGGKIPALDQRYHHAIAAQLPTTEMAMAVFAAPDEASLPELSGEPLPERSTLLLESRAAMRADRRVTLTLASRLVGSSVQVFSDRSRTAVLELEPLEGALQPVANYARLSGPVYRIASIAFP